MNEAVPSPLVAELLRKGLDPQLSLVIIGSLNIWAAYLSGGSL